MSINHYSELRFRGVVPRDSELLEKWYAMTDQFGYATGFKNYTDIREKIISKNPYSLTFMIMMNDTEDAIGFVMGDLKILDQKIVLWIHIIIIDPVFQGKGLGTCVVNKLINYARLQGAFASVVSVSENNKKGLSFWGKLGYVRSAALEESLSSFGPTGVAIMKRII